MFPRIAKYWEKHSFFIFGARGVGKSTWIRGCFPDALYLDLNLHRLESELLRNPDFLVDLCAKHHQIVIDEVQKIPKILDLVHKLIEESQKVFILTGSSARKLKRGGANLLAGRAFLSHMFPLTSWELGKRFDLLEVLKFGSLPKIFSFNDETLKKDFLEAYVNTYVREEILAEQLVRNSEGFRNFLPVAAQMNGKILNYTKIGKECDVQSKTVQTFFDILEDTYFGFRLMGFSSSFRAALKKAPKFYFFDIGVKRAIELSFDVPIRPGTSYYGEVFEHFVILEFFRLNEYSKKNYRFSYLKTKDDAEIDLVLSSGKEIILIEIKSSPKVNSTELNAMSQLVRDFQKNHSNYSRSYFLSQDPLVYEKDGIKIMPWSKGLTEIFS
jgi:predicted AAA+ superfamily ATPase